MYYDGKHDLWVKDRAKIAVTYVQGWFILDLVSVIPVDVIALAVGDSGSITHRKLKVSMVPDGVVPSQRHRVACRGLGYRVYKTQTITVSSVCPFAFTSARIYRFVPIRYCLL